MNMDEQIASFEISPHSFYKEILLGETYSKFCKLFSLRFVSKVLYFLLNNSWKKYDSISIDHYFFLSLAIISSSSELSLAESESDLFSMIDAERDADRDDFWSSTFPGMFVIIDLVALLDP